jgi:hypothetical protein
LLQEQVLPLPVLLLVQRLASVLLPLSGLQPF